MTELSSTINSQHTNIQAYQRSCFEASYLGSIEYSVALEIQKKLAILAQKQNQIFVLGLQHPDVITLGRRSDEAIEVTTAQHALPTIRSSRGGLATIHSSGQLVIYPIINLRHLTLGIRDYVQILLRTTQDLLRFYKIETNLDIKGAGLYTAQGKIAFCGIEVTNGVTQHGISINVRNNLELFSIIRSCGIQKLQLDRMDNYQIDDSLKNLFEKWIVLFKSNMIYWLKY